MPDPLTTPSHVKQGPFEPRWSSLDQHRTPEWFRDAKFGIWSHWGPQSAGGAGDWYAHFMYKEESAAYRHHVQNHGHPSEVGFKDIIRGWKAEHFEPEQLAQQFREAGARYIVAMATHHDNFDNWDSPHQPWNSVNLGPGQDIVGRWRKAALTVGLRFGVSIHNVNSWGWYDPARRADTGGPKAGVRYDGWLTRADGAGTWWEGYDPADLYGPPHVGGEEGDPPTPEFMANWFTRMKQLIDDYHPDLLVFDSASPKNKWRNWVEFEDIDDLPPPCDSRVGMLIAQHYYNSAPGWDVAGDSGVITLKELPEQRRRGATNVFEHTFAPHLMPEPWQKEMSLGDWHFRGSGPYLSPLYVIQSLIEVVSHNGNLLLNVVQRPDGRIDGDQAETLRHVGQWLATNGSAIYGSRPWGIAAEGPSRIFEHIPADEPHPPERLHEYGPSDIRFTCTADGRRLHAFLMAPPTTGVLTIRSLAVGSQFWEGPVGSVRLSDGSPVQFSRSPEGLHVTLPPVIAQQESPSVLFISA